MIVYSSDCAAKYSDDILISSHNREQIKKQWKGPAETLAYTSANSCIYGWNVRCL